MFNINGWELVIIGVLFILLFGPDRLPEVAGQMGRLLRDVRRMTEGATAELTRELDLAAREMRDIAPPAAAPADPAAEGRRAEGEIEEPAVPAAANGTGGGSAPAPKAPDRPPPAPSIFRPLPAAPPEPAGAEQDRSAGSADTSAPDADGGEESHPTRAGAPE